MRGAALLLAASCAAPAARPAAAPAPARPEGCREVAAGADLQAAADESPTLCLAPGRHRGPLTLNRAVSIWGPATAVVAGAGAGSVITFAPGAAGSRLAGITIDGSGTSFDHEGAAVRVGASGVVVEGVTIDGAVFGVLVERARGVTVSGNTIRGTGGPALGLRGDGIRLWETTDSTIAGNRISDSRDLVVWYSSRNHLHGNQVSGGRYGTHLMYSHDCVIEDNRYEGDVVGVFIMYSHGVAVRGNRVTGASGPAGMGVGLKDSGDITVTGNKLAGDTVGLYLDSSPVQLTHHNLVGDNLFAGCDAGVVFLGGSAGNTFTGNRFAENRAHVRLDGGDARAARWDGNAWDDYAGYDLDGDGVGDIPFELRSLAGDLVAAHPDVRLFEGAPALALLDAAGRLIPLYEPRLILRDEHPRVGEGAAGAR